MRNPLTACAWMLASACLLAAPRVASADVLTYTCQPKADAPPAQWFGGPWLKPVRLQIDTAARDVELRDADNKLIKASEQSAHLASLNNHQIDIAVDDSVIRWGVVQMWGFSGYIDRKSGQLDMLWVNSLGYSPDTLTRQFHGTCQPR